MASLRGGGPWGFRLQGGKDFGNPLSISKVAVRQVFVLLFKSLGFDLVVCLELIDLHAFSTLLFLQVTPGSKAALAGINSGDYILEVNGDSSDNMTHFDAQDAVRRAGQNLDLLLER